MQAFHTPILFLVFNRPDTTQQVFDVLRKIKPTKLFIAADGPRLDKDAEKEKCIAVRRIATQIDWECQLVTLFRDKNLGCGKAVSEAITWFFDHVDEGIILEDDCLPSLSFFHFCNKTLAKYRKNVKIMHIGGCNFQQGMKRGFSDLYFSKIPHVWGWATWKRAWGKYKYSISHISTKELDKVVLNNTKKGELRVYWKRIFSRMISEPFDTWDYQWHFAIWENNGLSITPNKNLISNIGFGVNATHTFDADAFASNNLVYSFELRKYPHLLLACEKADLFTYKNVYGIIFKKNLIQKLYLKNKIKKIKQLIFR
jgi:hypothetical protein